MLPRLISLLLTVSFIAGCQSTYQYQRPYAGNCPIPASIAADGSRCGARSAASRSGGYDGYGSWANQPNYGTVFVRGYYRKDGTYVRAHWRRR